MQIQTMFTGIMPGDIFPLGRIFLEVEGSSISGDELISVVEGGHIDPNDHKGRSC